MNTLPDLLNFVVTSLQLSPLCNEVHVVSTESFSSRQFTLKVRTKLIDDSLLQVRLYFNEDHIDYAYQLIKDDLPFLRWDNKEHFPNLSTYPHHFHMADGRIIESSLTGNPIRDLPEILEQLRLILK